jgi:hypothetical protein
MSYGSTAYGSASISGSASSIWRWFFPLQIRAPNTLFEAKAEFSSPSGLYSIYTFQATEPGSGSAGVTYKMYSSNDPDETPQLQSTVEGNGQTVVGLARFITVTAFIDGAVWGLGQIFSVRGRPGQ